MANTLINLGIILAYLVFGAAIILLVFFAIKGMIMGGKGSSKNTLISLGVIAAVVIIAFLISPASTGEFYTKHGVSPMLAKWIGTGLITTYIAFFALIILTIYSSVVKWFK